MNEKKEEEEEVQLIFSRFHYFNVWFSQLLLMKVIKELRRRTERGADAYKYEKMKIQKQ